MRTSLMRPTKADRLTTVVGAGFVLLLVNSAYVWAFAFPTLFYVANVLLHLGLGLALAAAFLVLLVRRPELRRPLAAATACFTAALIFGVFLAVAGNVTDHRWAYWVHIASAFAGIAAIAVAVTAPRSPVTRGSIVFKRACAAACVLLLVLPASAAVYRRHVVDARFRIRNPTIVPASMPEEGGGPQSPFFPSSAQTNVGGIIPANFFMDSAVCGECHRDIFDQWKSSVHHFASFNNQFYRKSIEYMQSVVGTAPSKWCAGCHDHAVFFNGRFERPIAEQIDTPEAHAGLACTSCHSIVRVDSTMGNGGFTIEYPPLHELVSSRNRFVRMVDRFVTYLNPEPHRRSFMKPFMRQDAAEFCAACHKVHLDVPVNQYRWFRGFNDYDNWQASGVSGQGARSFYYPETKSTCVDCHMPLVRSNDPGHHHGRVHSHRFPAANTAVPFVNHDTEQLQTTEAFLKSGFVTVDIFAVSPIEPQSAGVAMIRRSEAPLPMTGFGVGEEVDQHAPATIRDVGMVAAPIDKAQPALVPGSTARVDVVVRTRKIGHFFPGGTVDAFDVWLELQVRDSDGRPIFWSGQVTDEGRGPVESGAHFYRSYQLDGGGNPINKRNAWQARSLLYARLIPPGAADVAHFRVSVPSHVKGPLSLVAKLNYRKFSHYYTQFAYAGQPRPAQDPALLAADRNALQYTFDAENIPANVSGSIKGAIPALPIVTLAEARASLAIGNSQTVWTPVVHPSDRERWNDWGIGLLLQGDLKNAEYAFTQVTRAVPDYPDGWVNVARAMIQEGETDAAKPYLDKALQLAPQLGGAHFFKALVEKADGDYDAALRSLTAVAAQYPRDRVVWNQIGRLLFLARRYREAIAALDRVCLIDPEDVQMHYTLMLCYRATGDLERAAREQQLFERFKADESAQAITAARRMTSVEDNNERQLIHDHDSIALAGTRPVARSTGGGK